MTVNQDSIISELKMRVKLLETQDKLAAERMEEKLLLWLLSETVNQSTDISELIYGILERISIIRNISFSACCRVIDNKVEQIESYFHFKSNDSDVCYFELSPSLVNKLRTGPQFINNTSFDSEGIYFKDELIFRPEFVSIFPFQSLSIPFGVFVFMGSSNEKEKLSSIRIVINQIINMAIEKLEKLTLLEELKELNISFETKLQERTKKILDYNKQLKKEVKERKRNEKKLLEDKEIAERSDKMKSSFLSNMSHEIRTPINGILGFSEIIKNDDLLYDEKEKYTNIIKACGKSLLKIVDDVIDLSKIESELVLVNIEELQITKFMTELYDFFKNDELFKQKEKVELKLNINISGSTLFKTDKEKLWQILVNLIGNAIKYTEKGFVEIGCKIKDGEYVNGSNKDLLFFVKDSGIGIPKEMHKSVFDRFVKIEHDISKLYGGTGLGLTIAKNLVRLLGGEIWLKSEPKIGSEFYFTVPDSILLTNELENTITTDTLKEKYNWSDKLVLIVEDDEMSYIYLKEILKSTRINIAHASDGKQAVDIAYNNPDIDLILMDIKLPEMDGYEATRKIKDFRDSVPVIAQTAYAMADDHLKSIQFGCDDYITKPINRYKLLKTMELLLK